MALILDHVFVLVPSAEVPTAQDRLAELGLTPNVARFHRGQGTANALYCFDNAFLELLWVEDPVEAGSADGRRIGLVPRGDWRNTGALPFGIALRGQTAESPLPFDCWRYAPPWGRPLEVARSSDDLGQPFIFRAQRTQPPTDWPDNGAGERQTAGGFTDLRGVTLALAAGTVPSPDLMALDRVGLVALAPSEGAGRMVLDLGRRDGDAMRLTLPDFR